MNAWDGFLPEDDRRKVYDLLGAVDWETGWKSAPEDEGPGHWHKRFAGAEESDHLVAQHDCVEELKATAPIIHSAWRRLAAVMPAQRLVRCYANAYPYGTEGTIHTDAVAPASSTIVYFPHAVWHPDWGGELVFFNQDRSDIAAVAYPKPNRIVTFPGTVPHVARGVSSRCPLMRITLMFKVEAA